MTLNWDLFIPTYLNFYAEWIGPITKQLDSRVTFE